MQLAPAALICQNHHCQSPNPENHRFCHQCRTPLVKRYLWVVGHGLKPTYQGNLIQNRFLVKSNNVVLDTQPNEPICKQTGDLESDRYLELASPYLKLFSLRRHVPQPYTILRLDERHPKQFLLLEQAPLSNCDFSPREINVASIGTLPLEEAWSCAGSLRQLNWLWQIAQLWQPLANQQVVSSLLQPRLLRMEGSLVRLLELHLDQDWIPQLSALGYFWKQLLPKTRAPLYSFLSLLCIQLIEKQIENPENLIERLDSQLQLLTKSQSLKWAIATQTDRGPTRSCNEDACYPLSSNQSAELPLTIVCDGVGGHTGGDVASNLAVKTIAQKFESDSIASTDPNSLIKSLKNIIYESNDSINAQNDRQDQKNHRRMGTTLVMALLKASKLYVAHVGDSRAYWITRAGCYPITTDHNLLSRWVKTGLGFYRDMLQSSEGAKLFQAVGFTPSEVLQPEVQSLVIDEDCVILLCSDGLSDRQLVEEYWQTEILPILRGDIGLVAASRRLVNLANQKNGHDNVTVSLLHCTVA